MEKTQTAFLLPDNWHRAVVEAAERWGVPRRTVWLTALHVLMSLSDDDGERLAVALKRAEDKDAAALSRFEPGRGISTHVDEEPPPGHQLRNVV